MPSYLVTGTSRGLGLAFVAELLKNQGNIVIATARNTAGSPGLQKLKELYPNKRLVLLDLDVESSQSIHAAAEVTAKMLPNGLDNLISNAGVNYNGLKTFDEIDIEDFKAEVNFNIITPLLLLREFVPLVRKSQSKKVLVITSTLGSLDYAQYVPNLANGYSVSKAALNMLVRKYSTVLKNEGITIALLHPGWSGSTEIGAGIAPWIEKYHPTMENLSVETSATNSMRVLDTLKPEDNGEFFNHDGSKIGW